MEYDKKLFDEAVEMRNRNAQRSKKWIYEGEFRMPKPGEHFLLNGLVQLVPQVIGVMKEFPIVRPIPDDVVMVPREKIEALEMRRDSLCFSPHEYGDRAENRSVVDAILACAEQGESQVEIKSKRSNVAFGTGEEVSQTVPSDMVMVPRSAINSLRDGLASLREGFSDRALVNAAHVVLACVEPEKPKDEILEALNGLESMIDAHHLSAVGRELERIIAMREKELKERGK